MIYTGSNPYIDNMYNMAKYTLYHVMPMAFPDGNKPSMYFPQRPCFPIKHVTALGYGMRDIYHWAPTDEWLNGAGGAIFYPRHVLHADTYKLHVCINNAYLEWLVVRWTKGPICSQCGTWLFTGIALTQFDLLHEMFMSSNWCLTHHLH